MENNLIDGLKERISNAISINQSVGVILPSNNYHDFIQAIFNQIRSHPDQAWVYFTVTQPYETINNDYDSQSKLENVKFIDCISIIEGIEKFDTNCMYIESPSYLEKVIMEITNIFKNLDKSVEKFLVIDSLSSLLIYNDTTLVSEFYTHLINRTNLLNIHSISIAIEEEMNDNISKILYLRSNKIIKLKESFI